MVHESTFLLNRRLMSFLQTKLETLGTLRQEGLRPGLALAL